MSATLGVLLKELEPELTIEIYERLDVAAAESSDAWNNAGTGHSAFCELNYTPEKADGSSGWIDRYIQGYKNCRVVRDLKTILGVPHPKESYTNTRKLYNSDSAHELCVGRGECKLSA
jgi:L-2-hydroxyglutarate oxidase LhgO